jgi:hypothetical protein
MASRHAGANEPSSKTHSRPRGRERIDELRHARVGANVSMTLTPCGRKRTFIDDPLLGDAPNYARFGFSAAKTVSGGCRVQAHAGAKRMARPSKPPRCAARSADRSRRRPASPSIYLSPRGARDGAGPVGRVRQARRQDSGVDRRVARSACPSRGHRAVTRSAPIQPARRMNHLAAWAAATSGWPGCCADSSACRPAKTDRFWRNAVKRSVRRTLRVDGHPTPTK